MDDKSTREIYEAERPHDAIAAYKARITALEVFANEAWRLSMCAQSEIDNGDHDDAGRTMVQIAEAAAQVFGKK